MVSIKDGDDEEGIGLQDEHQVTGLDSDDDDDLHKPEFHNGHGDGDEENNPDEHEDSNAVAIPQSPGKDSKKSEKEEKKRLEKEKKEKEKQEKEEAKRLAKEQKKEKVSSRKSEREKKSPNIASPKRAGVRPKSGVKCRVHLLDGSEFETTLDKYAYGQHLVDQVCEHVNVLERDFFSCRYTGKRGIKFWLMHDRRIIKQMGEGPWVLVFEVKFYSPEPVSLHEDITRYQLCLQLRDDIASGKLPCSFVTYALLGSYTAQSEFGDYEPEEHGDGLDYVRDIQFAPNQTDDLLQKIAELHKTHMGQTPADAELNYLENAKKLLLYGVHLYPARDSELVPIEIGVYAGGISIFRDGQKINRFVWPKILKMAYKKKKFYLKIRPAEFEQFENTISFGLESHTHAKNLWRIALEHHTFFRLKEPLPIPTGIFSQFGSKFRYSGRTHYQSRSSRIDRANPEFDRSSSRRMTGSRSMDYGGSSFDQDSKLHSTSLDFKRKKGYEDEFNRSGDDKQVAVLAGTGPDAHQVAYVKTVRQNEEEEDRFDEQHRYQEINGFDETPQVSSFAPDRFSRNPDRNSSSSATAAAHKNIDRNSSSSATAATHKTIVTAVVNQSQSFDDENESLPPYPHPHDEQDASQVAPKRKSKKKTTTKTSKQTYTSTDGSTVTEYKTEKTATIETRVHNDLTVSYDETDIDHDAALARAILNVTEVDTDLTVDQIQVDPSQMKKTKKKKREKLLAA